MGDVSLLKPEILNGLIEDLEYPDSFLGMRLLGSGRPSAWPLARWDVRSGIKDRAEPTIPNVEAKIVPTRGIATRTAEFIYLREKKVFAPTTIYWVRQPGTQATKNAEAEITREVEDLDRRFTAFGEWCFWQMLSGTLTLDYADVKAVVDYMMSASHKPTVATAWSDSASDIIGDVRAWKRTINIDGGGGVARRLVQNGETRGYVERNAAIRGLFSDRLRDQFLGTGEVTGLLAMDWVVYDSAYDVVSAAGVATSQMYVPDDRVIMIADNPRTPFYLLEGPTADHSAPRNHIGKFAKSWREEDPSNEQYLLEWHFFPVLEYPDLIVYADVS